MLTQHDVQIILNMKVKIKILNDSAILFDIMIQNAPTAEKQLMIYTKNAIEA